MVLDILKENIVNILNVDPNEITEETTFIGDLCADSLDVYQIIVGVEEALNISLEGEDVEQISNVGEAVLLIEKVMENKQ
ncbi:MAG: acyl carrier protein [Lachnospiraceae bacterium]|nr:acyl carrier protein [Lachnospiraceae bacterium]